MLFLALFASLRENSFLCANVNKKSAMAELEKYISQLISQARDAAGSLAAASTGAKDAMLLNAAEALAR